MQRRVERISQAVVTIRARDDSRAFASVRALVLTWLREKAGRDLSEIMLRGESDSLDLLGAQRVETVALDDQAIWAARQDYQDDTVARRTWVTETMLAAAGPQRLLLGFRLHCVTLGETASFSRSVPRFMRAVAQAHCVELDGVNVRLSARPVDTVAETAALVGLISSPARKSPVIGISVDSGDNARQGLIDADRLARDVFGIGHVHTLSRAASFALTEMVGKRLSVFEGAVRVWWPSPQITEDDPYNHLLWLADRIRIYGAETTRRSVVDRALRASAGRHDADQAMPSFAEVRRTVAALRREAVAADKSLAADDLLPLFEAENLRLGDELKEMQSEHAELMAMADEDLRTARADRDAARNEIFALRTRLAEMDKAIRSRQHEADIEIPDSFEHLEAWAKDHLTDTVDLLPRALNAAKKSVFENPALAYQALLLLHEVYVPMRRSRLSLLKERWDSGLSLLGLECSPTHSGTRAGENASEYFVSYYGRKIEIDMHLKGSSSRDSRYGFRVYFFWHDETARVVVASLPSHLDTRIT